MSAASRPPQASSHRSRGRKSPDDFAPGKSTPWWLSAPALVLFTVLLRWLALGLTAVLSFSVYDPALGVKSGEFTLEHYIHLFTD